MKERKRERESELNKNSPSLIISANNQMRQLQVITSRGYETYAKQMELVGPRLAFGFKYQRHPVVDLYTTSTKRSSAPFFL